MAWNYDGRHDNLLGEIEQAQAALSKLSATESPAPCGAEPLVEVLGGIYARLLTGLTNEAEAQAALEIAREWTGRG